jgi:hypothetical protein
MTGGDGHSARDTEHWQQQLQKLLLDSQRAGLTATEVIDYFGVVVCGMQERNWSDERAVGIEAVRHNVRQAEYKIDNWSKETATDHDGGGTRGD